MHRISLALLWLFIAHYAPADDWLTKYETTGFLETARYDETVAFCKRLAEHSPYVEYQTFGKSAEGRELPLLWIDKSHRNDAPLFFVIAGIHAGEIDGKDAGLTFLRDALISDKYPGLLDNIRIAFVPIFNVDGHERFSPYSRSNQIGPKEQGWRTTAQNLNLNRDWMKADAPEMRAMLKEIARLKPDFLCDIHVTDGADYQYVITYGLGVYENEMAPIREYSTNRFLPALKSEMKAAGYEFAPYVSLRKGHDVKSGLALETYEPRYSTGYGTVINRPFILIETHSLKDYRTRVTGTYQFLKSAIELISSQAKELREANRAADSLASGLSGQTYVLSWPLTKDSVMTDFLGVDYGYVNSEISGGKVVRWSSTLHTFRVPVFENHTPADSITVPYAYVIPKPWFELVADIFAAHDVRVWRTTSPTMADVETYRFTNVNFAAHPYEGRFRAAEYELTPVAMTMSLLAGSAVIPLDQPRAQIAIHLLEPKGPDSFVRWGFFPQIFEQKEYMESYVVDTLAQRMLAESPSLAAEFQERLASDSTFAASSAARYQFFYERSPYWDNRKDLYPIGRIVSREEYEQLMRLTSTSSIR